MDTGKNPIFYEKLSVDCELPNGRLVQAGFLEVKIHMLMAKGMPFISEEFDSGGQMKPRIFSDEKIHSLANASSDGAVTNLGAYVFLRVNGLLRGIPTETLDEIASRLSAEVASRLNSREAMLQFYAVMNIPPPEGFEEVYPPMQMQDRNL